MTKRLPSQAASGAAATARFIACGLVVATSVAGVGCGDDDDTDPPRSSRQGMPFISLAEAQRVIERGVPAFVRTGGEADVGGVDGEPDLEETALLSAARYESQSGREFDMFVFADEAAARRGARTVTNPEDGESGIRAANVVAVFPERFSRVDAYRAVARAMRRLAVACDPAGGGEPQLRRLCFGETEIPPPGEGVDRDEAQDEEEPVVVGGLHYDPLLARRLNPRIAPDKAMLSGRRPPEGKVWFGVFLRVCNRSDRPRRSTDLLGLVDAFGERVEPSVLPAGDAFAYEPRSLEPDECLPAEGSVAERVGGALVLFAVSRDVLADLPIALQVQNKRVILNL